jgi:hypothetical protein
LTVAQLSVDKMSVDQMSVDQMSVDQMSIDQMVFGKKTCNPWIACALFIPINLNELYYCSG